MPHLSLQMSSPLFLLQFCGMVTCHYVLEILFWYLFLRVTKMPLIAPTIVQFLFRPLALSSTFSKIVERLILSRYESVFATTSLQFGLKPDSSTSLCTAAIKNIIARYVYNGSPVLWCFLYASKAFDLVDHDILFKAQMKRGLPLALFVF